MTNTAILVTFVVPTYRRPAELKLCLEHLDQLRLPPNTLLKVIVLDNGAPDDSRSVVEGFRPALDIEYHLNDPGHGLGYSLIKGATLATGDFIVELNDDALVPTELLLRMDAVFTAMPEVGVLGFRAIEEGYEDSGGEIGIINSTTKEVEANFSRVTSDLREVEHVYGFCYAYRRRMLELGARHDSVLLSKDYSSGNRMETDHCLMVKSCGFKVMYDGSLAVTHLAKPRGDMSERSLRWRVNAIRNTLYLFLKHFGLFGRKALALRYALTHDIGIRSAILAPSRKNLLYFLVGCWARASGLAHYGVYLMTARRKGS